jgi:hypothetical protein
MPAAIYLPERSSSAAVALLLGIVVAVQHCPRIMTGAVLWLTYLFFAPSPYAKVKEGDACGPNHHGVYGSGPDRDLTCQED